MLIHRGNGKTFKSLGVIPKDKNLIESFPSDNEGLVWANHGLKFCSIGTKRMVGRSKMYHIEMYVTQCKVM
jgi:hypothetical protein